MCGRRGDDAGSGTRPRADGAAGRSNAAVRAGGVGGPRRACWWRCPALLGQGLVEVGQQLYGSLKHGYYGLTSMLLSFGLMSLVRIKSPEGLTTHAPGEFGRVLGLDRAPEMKTARRKLAELAGRGQALEFSRAFAERWATEAPDALGYLYIDGHVRPYHGPDPHAAQDPCAPAAAVHAGDDRVLGERRERGAAAVHHGAGQRGTAGDDDAGAATPDSHAGGRRASGDVDLRPRGVEPEDLPDVDDGRL